MNWTLAAASLGIGIVVGLTGMGGGALMTPVLVFFFGVPPLSAVSSDLVAAAVMRPVASIVHIKNGNVRWDLVRWLAVGSVPCAFGGVLLARALGHGDRVNTIIEYALGTALVIAAAGLFIRAYTSLAERARHRDGSLDAVPDGPPDILIRIVPTLIIGALGGLVVGMTSVGSGSLIIISLMALYPGLRASQLVGTDLVQAVPLVFSAALGHLLFGDFQMSVTLPLLVGSIPGAYIGAQLSSRLPGMLIRRALAFVLLASAFKLLGIDTTATVVALVVLAALAGPVWMVLRKRHGFPAWPYGHIAAGATTGRTPAAAEPAAEPTG